DEFDAASTGELRLLLVCGQPGIGKSALIHEVHKPIVQKRGYFAAGKFDQFQRDIPYRAILAAFSQLLQQILTESEEQIAARRDQILDAVAPIGRVLTDVLPELELIIGPQPELPKLNPSAEQYRFNHVFSKFAHVFSDPAHPLVLFLDDLQWS